MTAVAHRIPVDVRTISPRDRHPLIFLTFGQLDVGEGLELINDHDPRPLFQSFQTSVPGQFAWDYLEQGPALWRVAITRLPQKHSTGQCCGSCGGA